MNQNKEKIDWSEECWKEMLVEQRKFMWLEDTVDKLAAWLGLKPGMTAVDVGCGLGYLGYTYWPYFGEGGHYIGVDISSKLVQDAAKAAKKWALNGEACFTAGDAYRLPFPDDFADLVMCQVLLIHLKEPELALAEMVRVAKPGGLIMCKEPDNLSSALVKSYNSIPEFDIDEELLFKKVHLISNKGRIKLGRGDWSISTRIPMIMKKLGLIDIDARINDKVWILEPPYEGPIQQHRLKMIKKNLSDEKTHKLWLDRDKEEFLAGGGDPEEYDRCIELFDRFRLSFRQQIEDGEYFACNSGDFYIIKGRKPKRI